MRSNLHYLAWTKRPDIMSLIKIQRFLIMKLLKVLIKLSLNFNLSSYPKLNSNPYKLTVPRP